MWLWTAVILVDSVANKKGSGRADEDWYCSTLSWIAWKRWRSTQNEEELSINNWMVVVVMSDAVEDWYSIGISPIIIDNMNVNCRLCLRMLVGILMDLLLIIVVIITHVWTAEALLLRQVIDLCVIFVFVVFWCGMRSGLMVWNGGGLFVESSSVVQPRMSSRNWKISRILRDLRKYIFFCINKDHVWLNRLACDLGRKCAIPFMIFFSVGYVFI